ncbi:hypothetical protein O7626_40990 [Micromonospora sp. WMMD1102]|uniref:DUF6247 family protein n=1 Tax=Micromonospora sp. WMMD1102 TaxID=3016105 RepID=UPI002414D4B8|nr:hypothetical protein [Micromonospora sp. WMMD1102]MDG4790735.1 hypothetical protein [Micromonospora sp. WMMD1102]MDG4792182.1 hypothetical protein [Micromonospora sp. WMMD1102]
MPADETSFTELIQQPTRATDRLVGERALRHSVLPWIRILPADAVDELVAEFVETVRAAAAVNNMTPVAQMLVEWQHTAEAYADPELSAALTQAHQGGPWRGAGARPLT